MITLPSDKLSLSSSAVLKVDDADRKPAQTFFNNYLKITDPIPQAAGSNYFPDNNQDFYISQATREKIWPKGETTVFKALLEKSFTHMGICLDDNITPAQAHAAWFHFLKFELPNDILTRTQASSFNMSCKDAIDRGGVASAYYNLMKSIELGHPLTRDEFERALQAPPAMVKARRMNKHIKNIWNAVFHTICQIETSKGELPDNLTWINDWLADTVSYTKNLRPIRKHYHFDHSEGSTSPEEGHSRQLGTITRGPDKLSNSDESTTGSSDDSSDGAQEHKGL